MKREKKYRVEFLMDDFDRKCVVTGLRIVEFVFAQKKRAMDMCNDTQDYCVIVTDTSTGEILHERWDR